MPAIVYDALPALPSSTGYCSPAWRRGHITVDTYDDAYRAVKGLEEGCDLTGHEAARTAFKLTSASTEEYRRIGLQRQERIAVHDARGVAAHLSLDEHGFALVQHPAGGVRDWADHEELRTCYYPPLLRKVKEQTGAVWCAILDSKFRTGETATGKSGGGYYAGFVHSDLTPHFEWHGGGQRPAAGRVQWGSVAGRHFAVVNCWRSVGEGPVRDNHLALVDPASVDDGDPVLTEAGPAPPGSDGWEGGWKTAIWRLAHSERHRWVYFPGMRRGEVLMFKQYDTREARLGRRQVFHSSVPDASCPAGVPLRRSCEVRVLCVFGPDADRGRAARFLGEVRPMSERWQRLANPYLWHPDNGPAAYRANFAVRAGAVSAL